jgi:hypothetical protein
VLLLALAWPTTLVFHQIADLSVVLTQNARATGHAYGKNVRIHALGHVVLVLNVL